MSIEIRELVIKSTILSSRGNDQDENLSRQDLPSRSELLDECRRMMRDLLAESRRR